jgi:tetratricopeptide (TPR) repeat protein
MSETDPASTAAELFRQAYELQMRGDYQQALELYGRSIATYPTAEAYTFRGWTYSFLGEYDHAIQDCHQAIRIDPDFGNPYNDIGAYLIEQEKWDDAIPWFEKAMAAKRYEARCFPHFNLGRVYEHQRKWEKAKKCYRQAYSINQEYRIALAALRRVTSAFN